MLTRPAVLRLVSDTDEILIRPEAPSAGDPIICTQWDLGSPSVREVTTDRVGADGVRDLSAYTGSRTVTLDLVVRGNLDYSAYAWVERLAAMTHPNVRPRLRITRATSEALGQTWELGLRGNPFSIAYGRRAAAMLELQLTFSAPLGYLESGWRTGLSGPATLDSVAGFAFPIPVPFSTGTLTESSSNTPMLVEGSAPVTPVVYIYGPVTDPEIITETGERFAFTGLTLASGSFVQIDMGAGTVRIGANRDANVYHLVNFAVSTFWQWAPGEHRVRYLAKTGRVAVQWRDRRLTI